ncbi:hypothetical protein EYZ11_005467 [Aspergillus tanneri]|uniref:Uncharacterized protein n=1 Tax=Aspergillus tanneri TaxID=1220188 RepID=A0A4S3JIA7_9EURO|nr:hypothetical protein EYZ11_005467 [Aspergillus tanneri]
MWNNTAYLYSVLFWKPSPIQKLESEDAIRLLLQSCGLSAENTMCKVEYGAST